MIPLAVLGHVLKLDGSLLGDILCRPDLSMWMWVRAAHDGAFILKDLDVVDMFLLLHLFVGRDPGVNHGHNLGLGHVSEGLVMLG